MAKCQSRAMSFLRKESSSSKKKVATQPAILYAYCTTNERFFVNETFAVVSIHKSLARSRFKYASTVFVERFTFCLSLPFCICEMKKHKLEKKKNYILDVNSIYCAQTRQQEMKSCLNKSELCILDTKNKSLGSCSKFAFTNVQSAFCRAIRTASGVVDSRVFAV